MTAAAHWAGCELYNTILIASVNKLFFVRLEYSSPLCSIHCIKNKKQNLPTPHPTPPPIIRTIIIIYSICYRLIH